MMILNINDALRTEGVDLDEYRPDNPDKSSQFVCYHLQDADGDLTISVESTARIVMEGILCLPLWLQEQIFFLVARNVTQAGEQIVLSEDSRRRGARAVRLASRSSREVKLLLTH